MNDHINNNGDNLQSETKESKPAPDFPVGKKLQDFDNPISNNFVSLELGGEEEPEQVEEFAPSPFIEVEFKSHRRSLFRNELNHNFKMDDLVVVEVDNGIDVGNVCAFGNDAVVKMKNWYKNREPELKVVRAANDGDIAKHQANRTEEIEVVDKCRELVEKHSLDMKVTEAEWQFDRQRLTIYFTAPQRVDFRELVKELARNFKTRIELRQISTREETKRMGDGFGCCGLKLCCTSFLNDFCHVTLDHARTQQLSNNIAKLSGYCGRLKCCLLYEYDNYVKAFDDFPPVNSTVKMKEGIARIIKIDIYKEIIYLHLQAQNNYITMTLEEIKEYVESGKIRYPENYKEESVQQDVNNEDY